MLTHAATGKNFHRSWPTIGDARDAARRIANLCDWTDPDPMRLTTPAAVLAELDETDELATSDE